MRGGKKGSTGEERAAVLVVVGGGANGRPKVGVKVAGRNKRGGPLVKGIGAAKEDRWAIGIEADRVEARRSSAGNRRHHCRS